MIERKELKKTTEIDLTSPRPLAEVARLLETFFSRMVTYEDPPYCYPDDMVRDEEERLIPRGGRIFVQYQVGDSLLEVIQRALEVHARLGYPGMFTVKELAGNYHIVPQGFRNADGAMKERISLLDTTISLPSQRRSGLQLVEDITLALNEVTKESVRLGMFPINAFIQHVSVEKVLQGKARELLVGLFREMGLLLSWQLLNNPGTAEFFLNIYLLGD